MYFLKNLEQSVQTFRVFKNPKGLYPIVLVFALVLLLLVGCRPGARQTSVSPPTVLPTQSSNSPIQDNNTPTPAQDSDTSTPVQSSNSPTPTPNDSNLPAPIPAALGEPFRLKINQTAQVENKLAVTFLELTEDSRCPPDVDCFWSGQVGVLLEIKGAGQNLGRLELSTVNQPTGQAGNYTIEIIQAEPPPAKTTEEIPTSAYVITLMVKQADEVGYIDTHMHLDGLYRSGNTEVKDYKTAADNLVAKMDRYGVAKALIMPPPQNPGQRGAYDYQNLLEATQRYPDRLYLVAGGGTLNPLIHGTAAAAVTPELQAQFEEKAGKLIEAGAIAFGEMTALHLCMSETHHYIQVSPDHPLFLLLADLAARHNVPIDMHMEAVSEDMPIPPGLAQSCSANPATIPATIPAFERFLAHNRGARIVWQHIGWDNTGHMTVELLRQLLQAHPNLYLALRVEEREFMVGGNGPMPNRIVDEGWKIRPEWLELISNYPDRFMIGGDEFVGIPGQTPRKPQSFAETWPILDQLPPDLARKVGYDNAARVYNLD